MKPIEKAKQQVQTKLQEVPPPRFKNAYNKHLFGQWAEDTMVEMYPDTTLPDMALTLPQIVQRFTRGLPITGERFAIYEEDDEMVYDLSMKSKIDIEEIKKEMQDELMQIQKRAEERAKKQAANLKKQTEDRIKELQAKVDALKEPNSDTTSQRTSGPAADQGKS